MNVRIITNNHRTPLFIRSHDEEMQVYLKTKTTTRFCLDRVDNNQVSLSIKQFVGYLLIHKPH